MATVVLADEDGDEDWDGDEDGDGDEDEDVVTHVDVYLVWEYNTHCVEKLKVEKPSRTNGVTPSSKSKRAYGWHATDTRYVSPSSIKSAPFVYTL